jgi:DNA-binding CsgD family transcriptional regulator
MEQDNHRALLSAIETAYSISGIEQFPAGVLSAVRKIFPFDIISYNELDLLNSKSAWLTEPSLEPESLKERFTRHMSEHPLVDHYARTGDGKSHMISDFLSQRQFHNLGIYSEFYRPLHVQYILGTTISVSPGHIVSVALCSEDRNFSENERQNLDLLRPHLVRTYRNVQTLDLIQRGAEAGGRKVIIVSRSGQVQLVSDEVWRLIASFFGLSRPSGCLPGMLNNWIRYERSRFNEESEAPSPSAPLIVSKGSWQLAVHFLWGGKAAEQDMLLLETQPAELTPALQVNSELTPREAEILAWVTQGKTNAEIGEALLISTRTVKKHLEHIYSKLRVHRRGAAVARFHRL